LSRTFRFIRSSSLSIASLAVVNSTSFGPPIVKLAMVDFVVFNLLIANLLLVRFDFHLFVFNVQSQAVVNTHVLVRDPDQSEECYNVPAPIQVKQLVTRDD
jgi:hypothetical protein